MCGRSSREATMSSADPITENREELEDLAERDLACSWIAKALLETMNTEA
jgi:hypothetical protein